MTATLCAAVAATALTGCLQINSPRERSSVNVREPGYSDSAPPAADNRPIGVIAAENAQLRARLAALENDYRTWTAATDTRKDQIKDLKRQRDDLKKDRDRWKKAARRDD